MLKQTKKDMVKALVQSGLIKEFSQIFIYVQKTPVAKDLGITFSRFDGFLEDVKGIKFNDMYLLCNYFDIEPQKMFELIHNQHIAPKKSTRKK